MRAQAQTARDELRRVVDFSVADGIEKLDRLQKAGSIRDVEFSRLRAKLVQCRATKQAAFGFLGRLRNSRTQRAHHHFDDLLLFRFFARFVFRQPIPLSGHSQ